MRAPERIERAAQRRIASVQDQIETAVKLAERGVPLAAEPVQERVVARVQQKTRLPKPQAELIARSLRAARAPVAKRAKAGKSAPAAPPLAGGPERIWGDSLDFVSASFLERGVLASRAVARIAFRDGRPQGTGFLISDRLLLTNNHVISDPAAARAFEVEFEYELGLDGAQLETTRFTLAPQDFFVTDEEDDLDFTVVALGPKLGGRRELRELGFCALSDATNKHALGEVANIVQHPAGRYKEVVLRENRLVTRLDTVLHYVADTEPGSSGSPVFNNEWSVIALHHWGGPFRQRSNERGPVPLEVNEGIRISAIVAELRARAAGLATPQRSLLEHALRLGEAAQGARPRSIADERPVDWTQPRMNDDGTATWQVPIELTVRLPGMQRSAANDAATAAVVATTASAEAKVKPSTSYGDRSGYKPRFLSGHPIELPQLSRANLKRAARNRQAEPGDDPRELKYHHFSIVMNKVRRLAFFTACNIDGSKSKKVDRDKGTVSPLDPNDDGLQESLPGAEASESWYGDKRLDESEYAGAEFYTNQNVPGFPDKQDFGRTLRMFQRGHIVRRMDPAWGSDDLALRADADTFHWTNCSPQVGFFNMGRAWDRPGTGGGKLWRAIENYVLRNARTELQRVSVFSGPVFRSNDRAFRGLLVPGEFWKIVAWVEDGGLRSLAMLADQRSVIREGEWPEALEPRLQEAFTDPDQLERVADFVTTVAEIEAATGLDFGDAVRDGDIHAGAEARQILAVEEAFSAKKPARRNRIVASRR